jgi:glutaredoxin 3
MTTRFPCLLLLMMISLAPAAGAETELPHSHIIPKAQQQKKYPRIVLYSVAWCPHCKEAKEYLTKNNIPFINKDVELEEQYMKELTETYKSTGVPVIVIGADRKILKGFKKEEFEKALKEAGTP